MSKLIEKARELATEKHAGVVFPDDRHTPMLEHVGDVVRMVTEHGGSEEMIASAWLHDVVEDTDVTLTQIGAEFGPVVLELVDGLTDPEHFAALPLAERKRLQAERARTLPEDVRRVKICDQTSNVRRLVDSPPNDWSLDMQWTYAEGAAAIARECEGLWPDMDREFEKALEALRRKTQAG